MEESVGSKTKHVRKLLRDCFQTLMLLKKKKKFDSLWNGVLQRDSIGEVLIHSKVNLGIAFYACVRNNLKCS